MQKFVDCRLLTEPVQCDKRRTRGQSHAHSCVIKGTDMAAFLCTLISPISPLPNVNWDTSVPFWQWREACAMASRALVILSHSRTATSTCSLLCNWQPRQCCFSDPHKWTVARCDPAAWQCNPTQKFAVVPVGDPAPPTLLSGPQYQCWKMDDCTIVRKWKWLFVMVRTHEPHCYLDGILNSCNYRA